MLYDILPPLLLFISFGGIIVLISRVMMRIRGHKVSAEIQAEVDSTAPVHTESVIGPNKGNIHIMGNRLVHVISSIRAYLASRRAAKQVAMSVKEVVVEQAVTDVPARKIQMPNMGIKDKLSALGQRIAARTPDVWQHVRIMQEQIISKMPVRTVQPEIKRTPVMRLVHQEPVPAQKQGIISQILKRDKEETPLEKAETALNKNDFDTAEDILVPYLMKHAADTKAYMLLGKTASGKGSWGEAIEIFQQVLKINNEEVDAYAQLGHAALQAGKFTVAIQALQRARDNEPDNVRIREELLFIARRMDNKVVEKSVTEELVALHAEVQEPQQEKVEA